MGSKRNDLRTEFDDDDEIQFESYQPNVDALNDEKLVHIKMLNENNILNSYPYIFTIEGDQVNQQQSNLVWLFF